MTDTPDQPLPASDAVDPTDERLSAALDGESDDLGVLDAPDTAPRARALAAARDLVASPPTPLDDVTRRRLLDTARAAGPPSRRAHRFERWSAPAAVAALLLVVVLGGWGLISVLSGVSNNSNGSKAASRDASMTTGPLNLDSLGEVSTPTRLLQGVKAALKRHPPENRSTVPGAACKGTVKVPTDVTLEVLARATFHGAAAVVLVGRAPPRTLVYVLATADCRLLSAQFFTG